jgi:hypothetical protein
LRGGAVSRERKIGGFVVAYSRMEQETSIVWDEEEKVSRIYTSSPVSMRKLDRLCEQYPREYLKVWEEKDADGRVTAARYQTGCKRVRFVKPASEARIEQGRRIAAMAAERRKEGMNG